MDQAAVEPQSLVQTTQWRGVLSSTIDLVFWTLPMDPGPEGQIMLLMETESTV